MFEVNDKVIHAREGLSTIVNVVTMAGNDYFIVHADRGGGENIYVPVKNASTLMRPIHHRESFQHQLTFVYQLVQVLLIDHFRCNNRRNITV